MSWNYLIPLLMFFTQSFQIFSHTIVCFWLTGNIFKVVRFLVTMFVLLFTKLNATCMVVVYQIYEQHQKFKIVSFSSNFVP